MRLPKMQTHHISHLKPSVNRVINWRTTKTDYIHIKNKKPTSKSHAEVKTLSEFQVTERNAPLPNIRGHTYVPWAASGTSQLGCSAESHHHGVWRWFGYTAAAASNTASRSSPGNVH